MTKVTTPLAGLLGSSRVCRKGSEGGGAGGEGPEGQVKAAWSPESGGQDRDGSKPTKVTHWQLCGGVAKGTGGREAIA